MLLLDISMPDMDGYELLETLRGLNRLRAIPAVAVTAHAYERDKECSAEAGFAVHVSKPYDIAALVEVLGNLAAQERKGSRSRSFREGTTCPR